MKVCYYPTRVLFIDDDLEQIDLLKERMSDTRIKGEFYTDPKEALQVISESYQNPFLEGHVFKDANILERKERISVVVADYNMPGLTGLDIFNKMRDRNTYKILHTGAADESFGLKQLNDGRIHNYFRKSDDLESLILKIYCGENIYFESLYKNNYDKVRQSSLKVIFESEVFKETVKNLIHDNNIEEYYLLDDNGSYFMLNQTGQEYTLLVMPSVSKQAQLDILEAEGAQQCLIDDVREEKKMFYIHNSDIKKRNYQNFIFPATKLEVKELKIFFTFVSGNPLNIKYKIK